MADLQKLFVLVSEAQTATFKTQYATAVAENNPYYNKICFLEGTSEIYTKGHIYGMSDAQATKLSNIIAAVGLTENGTLPASKWGASADSIKDAANIIAAVIALDAKAKALQTELDAEIAKVAASKTLNENYEFTGKIKYVAAAGDVPAHIALCDEKGTELSTVAVSDIIGNGVLKSSSYNKETGELLLTFAQADGTTKVEKINLADMLDINDVQIAAGSTNYMGVDLTGGENSQAIFSIKVSKMAGDKPDTTLTGLADAADVKAYVDAQVSGKNVSAEGDSYVSATATDNKVTVAAQIGNMVFTAANAEGNAEGVAKLEGTTGKLVDSGVAATAIKGYADAVVAKEASDRTAAINKAIGDLDVPEATVGAGNVQVTYSETDGKVAISSVAEKYAEVTRTATGESVNAAILVKSGDEAKLIKASDLNNVALYAADKALEEQHRVDAKIAALGGDKSGAEAGVSTQVTTVAGQVNSVVVTVDDNVVTSGGAANARTLTATSTTNVIKGDAIAAIKEYVDNVVGDSTTNLAALVTGDEYITASVDETNNKKIKLSADVQALTFTKGSASVDSTLGGELNSLVDGADVASKVSSFVNNRISEEIAKLDVTEATTGDDNSNIRVTYSETDGKINIKSVTEKYAGVTYTPASGNIGASFEVTEVTKDQLVKGSDIAALKSYVDAHVSEAVASLDSDITVKDASNFVTVKTVIVDGKLADTSSVAVTYAEHTAAPTAASITYSKAGIATSAFVSSVLGDLWETYTPKA